MVIRAAIKAAGVRSVAIKGPELLNKYIGQSEAGSATPSGAPPPPRRARSSLTSLTRFAQARTRLHRRDGSRRQPVSHRAGRRGGLRGVVVLAATSRPDLVDPRCCGPAGWTGCSLRLSRVARGWRFWRPLERTRIVWTIRGRSTRTPSAARGGERHGGFSGADLRAIVTDARMHAVHRAMDELDGAGRAGRCRHREDVKRAGGRRGGPCPEGARASTRCLRSFAAAGWDPSGREARRRARVPSVSWLEWKSQSPSRTLLKVRIADPIVALHLRDRSRATRQHGTRRRRSRPAPSRRKRSFSRSRSRSPTAAAKREASSAPS